MRALLLAAGEGRRMLPLTAQRPKPLLPLAGSTLIELQLRRLKAAGVDQVVINLAYLGEQIAEHLGDGAAAGLQLTYSWEPYPLETGGALARALPHLGAEPFLLVNGDVLCDYPLAQLRDHPLGSHLGHLVLVDNPSHNPGGDYRLSAQGQLTLPGKATGYTFAGISKLSPELIERYGSRQEKWPLRDAFNAALADGGLSGEHYPGYWLDVGTPERLNQAEQDLASQRCALD